MKRLLILVSILVALPIVANASAVTCDPPLDDGAATSEPLSAACWNLLITGNNDNATRMTTAEADIVAIETVHDAEVFVTFQTFVSRPVNGTTACTDAGTVAEPITTGIVLATQDIDSSWCWCANGATNEWSCSNDATQRVGNGSTAGCLLIGDSDGAGVSACETLNGTLTCEVDTNGICGDAT